MEFQEYPKGMYRDGVHMAVADEAEEAAAAVDGYTDWHTDHAKMNGAAEDAGEKPAELSYAEMKEKAAKMGLTFAHNISRVKLAELIADAEKG